MEIFLHAVYWQNFFDKSSPGDYFGSFGYASCIAVFGINLSDPTGITITGRTYEDLGMKIAEIEGCESGCRGGRHGLSVDEKWRWFKRIDLGVFIFLLAQRLETS
jgi:hypothetical protein